MKQFDIKYIQNLKAIKASVEKEIRENLNKWIDQPCLWSGKFSKVKMLIILEL